MKVKIIIAVAATLVALVFGSMSFMESNVEYGDFKTAETTHKKIQVKGTWEKDKDTHYDSEHNQFVFFMKDDNNDEMKVILDGARPNNFELAQAVVAKGRVKDGCFYASDVLTKCPSKYEGDAETVKKTI